MNARTLKLIMLLLDPSGSAHQCMLNGVCHRVLSGKRIKQN